MADDYVSPDDALENTDDNDYDIDTGGGGTLPEDGDRPFAPADDPSYGAIPPDHPSTDSNLDAHEIYDEGLTSATEINATDETDEDSERAFTSTQ